MNTFIEKLKKQGQTEEEGSPRSDPAQKVRLKKTWEGGLRAEMAFSVIDGDSISIAATQRAATWKMATQKTLRKGKSM